jgi:CheY-like chemotaxis protein
MARILIVDDDPLICSSIRTWVEAAGHRAVIADGASAGLKALKDAEFDAMVVDIFMPHMHGFESVRLFHQQAPTVPLIAISGYVFAEQRVPVPDFLQMALKLGASKCLRKPFTPTALLSITVRMYLPQVGATVLRFDDRPRMEEGALPRGTEAVLVVEDDPFVRSLVVMRLYSLGYSVVTAVDTKDALRKLRSDVRIDVLFTDIVMPGGINGYQLAELATEVRPGLPILLTSGFALETLAKQGRLQQVGVVLNKPYRKEALALRLREVLSASSVPHTSMPAPRAATGA